MNVSDRERIQCDSGYFISCEVRSFTIHSQKDGVEIRPIKVIGDSPALVILKHCCVQTSMVTKWLLIMRAPDREHIQCDSGCFISCEVGSFTIHLLRDMEIRPKVG